MKCLVIAAGFGSRLTSIAPSKPLTPVAGTPLIEHVLRRAVAGGASDFVVVTGHQAATLEAFLGDLASRIARPIACVRAEDWSRPNGYSVLAAADRLPGKFLLMMADHIFEPEIVTALIASDVADDALKLAVDRRLDNPLIEPEDATRVALEGDRIVRIGKGIQDFDATDTGIFLTTPALHDALAASMKDGVGSLSGGVQKLADAGKAFAFDIGTRWWIDVDDPPSHRMAEAALSGAPLTSPSV